MITVQQPDQTEIMQQVLKKTHPVLILGENKGEGYV